MASYSYSTPYRGMSSGPLPSGYMEAATSGGRYLAAGISQLGEGIEAAIEKYRDHREQSGFYDQKLADYLSMIEPIAASEESKKPGTSEYNLLQSTARLLGAKDDQGLFDAAGKIPSLSLGKKKAMATDIAYALDRYDKDIYKQQAKLSIDAMRSKQQQERALSDAIGGIYGLPTTESKTELVAPPTIEEKVPMQGPPMASAVNSPLKSDADVANPQPSPSWLARFTDTALRPLSRGGVAGAMMEAIDRFSSEPAPVQQFATGMSPQMRAGLIAKANSVPPVDLGDLNREAVPEQLTSVLSEFAGPYTETKTTKRPYEDVLRDSIGVMQKAGVRLTPENIDTIRGVLTSAGVEQPPPEGMELTGVHIRDGKAEKNYSNIEVKKALIDAEKQAQRDRRTVYIKNRPYIAKSDSQFKNLESSAVAINEAEPLFDNLISIASKWDNGKLNIDDIAASQTDVLRLRGALKEAINGVGAMSNQDMERLVELIPNPTDWKVFKTSNWKVSDRLKRVRSQGFGAVNARLKTMGYDPIDFEGGSNDQAQSEPSAPTYIRDVNGKLILSK